MRIHWLQHVSFEELGSIGEWAHRNGHELTCTRMYQQDHLPEISNIDWLIIMGGPMGVHDETQHPWLIQEKRLIGQAIAQGRIVLGVCLGAQLIAHILGAKVFPNAHREIGWFPVEITRAGQESPVFHAFPSRFDVFHWHGDTFDMPAGTVHLASSTACANQAFLYTDRVLALQFHLEVTPENVSALLKNCAGDLRAGPYVQSRQEILKPKEEYGRNQQFMDEVLQWLSKVGTNT